MLKKHGLNKEVPSRPQYSLFDIQMDVGEEEFKKGYKLFTDNSVGKISKDSGGFSANVQGTHEYIVSVGMTDFDKGFCNCYLGQKDMLCKHMIALAISVVSKYGSPEDNKVVQIPIGQAVCSVEVREITKEEMADIKKEIRSAMMCIKSYNGPSKKWFEYQDSLIKGSRLMLHALSKLPICKASVDVCIELIKKLDTKLAGVSMILTVQLVDWSWRYWSYFRCLDRPMKA